MQTKVSEKGEAVNLQLKALHSWVSWVLNAYQNLSTNMDCAYSEMAYMLT